MAAYYALNMNFDPASTTGLFLPYNSSDNTGRAWWKSTDGQATWQFAGNPDSYAPDLSWSATNADLVQFAVGPLAGTTPSPSITGVAISVIFSTDRKASDNPAKVASPFQLNSNPRCILSDTPGTFQNWYFIGPYSLALNAAFSGNGRLKFEFSLACRVTFSDGTTKDFGYDPEMDVDV